MIEHTGSKKGRDGPGARRGRPPIPPYVVVRFKFDDGKRFVPYAPLDEPKESYVRELWADLLRISPGLRLRPLFRAIDPAKFEKLIEEAKRNDPRYRELRSDLFEYFQLVGPQQADFCRIAARVSMDPRVRYAYVERPAAPPAVDYLSEPSFAAAATASGMRQFHHEPAPAAPATPAGGIDSVAAWKDYKLDGAGVTFFDVELGWLLDHEDLQLGALVPHGVNDPWPDSQAHGAAVLGILCAKDGSRPGGPVGGVGIAPNATPQVVSCVEPTTLEVVPELALQQVAALANAGDVVVLEQQVYESPTSMRRGPLELAMSNYDLIRLLTARGVIVIEAGGNGDEWTECIDLDLWTDELGVQVFNRAAAGVAYRDSGAIIVGAAAIPAGAPAQLDVAAYWPRGGRVDCFAWGRGVYTCWDDGSTARNVYTPSFGDTSAATAIVAGAAILMQQQANLMNAGPLGVGRMRQLLTDPKFNTAAPPGFAIGLMPDLSRLLPQIP